MSSIKGAPCAGLAVRQAPKGHFPEALHIALVELIREVIPEGAQVVFVGDGEFDGTALQATLHAAGWSYAYRTAMSTVATCEGATFRLDTLGACSKPGTLVAFKEVQFTQEAYGPVMVLSCWAKGYHEPLYLVSNMAHAEEACRWYEKRFRIETVFLRPEKSRVSYSYVTYVRCPTPIPPLDSRVSGLYMGCVFRSLCEAGGWKPVIHRRKRCDLSLFSARPEVSRPSFK